MADQKELRGWLAARNLNIDCLGRGQALGDGVAQYTNLLHKFPQDEIFLHDGKRVCFLTGYVYHIQDFLQAENHRRWDDAFVASMERDIMAHFQKLRGAFCGYTYKKDEKQALIYTDHTSNKAVYYYTNGDTWIVSNYVDFIARVLRANGITFHFNPVAAQYMLTYGYMLDDSTYIKEIHRLMPGCYGVIDGNGIKITQYYKLACHEQEMSEEEALERLDVSFRQAIDREFGKDREYGYRHLVDLSAGLDSRMVCFVAHDMGYTEQTNLSYSKLGYRDDLISGKIARYLGHEYLFKSLDDIRWMYDIDEMTLKNNGAAICLGITGGNRMLKTVNMEGFGIEHTGIIGGPTMASYYQDKNLAYGKPQYGLNGYSDKLHYTFDEKVLEQHETQEAFAMNTRGLLGMQVSYMTRQNYLETSSPFADVDMLETAFSIPFEYRRGDRLYLRWIAEKYPDAAKFGWEKWGGVKPQKSHIFLRKIKTTQRLAYGYLCRLFSMENAQSMNPMDYWYHNNTSIRNYLDKMYEDRIGSRVFGQELAADMKKLYETGNFIDKSLVLTVLSAVHLYFGDND
ncbi:MAG: hypothetical protein LUI12_11465 [Clostridiales bacterium]|nr:hypothetical protein [Clostridiales bacterium]